MPANRPPYSPQLPHISSAAPDIKEHSLASGGRIRSGRPRPRVGGAVRRAAGRFIYMLHGLK